MNTQTDERLARAYASLDGLSVGDAFGGCFFAIRSNYLADALETRTLASAPWSYTDDTLMALSRVSAQDTVPFVLWCASLHLDNFEEALWLTASGLGDVDTTCAMVGGIVATYTGTDGIPSEWRAARESLPQWPFLEQYGTER